MTTGPAHTGRRSSRTITLGLLAVLSAIPLTGCDERAKQRRAQECLTGLRDRTSIQCQQVLARYPYGYSSPINTGFWYGGWFHGGRGYGYSSGWGSHGASAGYSSSRGAVTRGGFGSSASGHAGS